MDNQITITAVSENTSMRHSFLSQHGQSLHINYSGNQYLFDVAEIYEGLTYNLRQLGFELSELKSIIISHNHLDHSGSLPKLLPHLTTQTLYLPPDMAALEENGYKESYRFVNGKLHTPDEVIKNVTNFNNAVRIEKALELEEGLYSTGPLEGKVLEQSLIMAIPDKGLVVLVGCSHPTLPVIIEKAKLVAGIDKIYGLIGGFHYKDSTDEQIVEAVEFMKLVNPEFIVPSHCTGYKAIAQLQVALGEKIKVSPAGQFGTGNSIQLIPELQFNLLR